MADEDPADQGLSLAYRAGRPADSEPGSAAILERACFLGEDAGGARWRLWHRLVTPSKDQGGHGEDLVGDVTTKSPTGTARTALALVRAGVELTATEAARPRLVAILRELSQPGETESLGEQQPPDLRALLGEVADAVERGRGHVRPRVSARTLPPLVKFPADRIHAGTVQGLARAAEWCDGVGGFFRALEVEGRAGYRQLVGFHREPEAELWDFLRDRGEAAIKAHYALWARCYEETGGAPNKWVTMSVPQFCADLGYARQKAGGYKTRDKQHAMRLLEALTTAELAVEVRVGRKVRQITGPIWTRGLQARQRDEYSDLFGSQRVGDTTLWDPVGFTFRPGPWFEDEEWRKRNAYVGMVGAGLLRLDTRQDRWALRLGGYYASLSRFGHYAPRSVTVATVLARTGLGKLNVRNPAEQEVAFERAHDRLVEVGVLERWCWTGEEVGEEPDMDDPDTLARLADYGAGDWRRKRVSLTWPASLGSEGTRIENAQRQALTAAKRRRRRPPSPSRG
jgi:hypothetical protein